MYLSKKTFLALLLTCFSCQFHSFTATDDFKDVSITHDNIEEILYTVNTFSWKIVLPLLVTGLTFNKASNIANNGSDWTPFNGSNLTVPSNVVGCLWIMSLSASLPATYLAGSIPEATIRKFIKYSLKINKYLTKHQ